MGPVRKISFAGRDVWLSRVINSESRHSSKNVCLVYVPDGDSYRVLPLITSGSQSNWRYYPAYLISRDGNVETTDEVEWFSKAHDEQSLGLPWQLQQKLDVAGGAESIDYKQLSGDDLDLLLVGATKAVITPARNPGATISAAVSQGAELAGVEKRPVALQGIPSERLNYLKTKPEAIQFSDANQSPDFSRPLARWKAERPVQGAITYDVFASKDGLLHYTFARDAAGRAWVAQVEQSRAPINRNLLHDKWVEAGVLATPADEYRSQVGPYGGEWNGYGYVDSFKNFLSKVPVIKEYLAAVGAPAA